MSEHRIGRRQFLAAVTGAAAVLPGVYSADAMAVQDGTPKKPNLLYVFADQWRAQATGYAGDPNVHTPHLNALAGESVNFTNAVSCCPVCSPYRASLLSGCYPLTHGVFLNDVCLGTERPSIAEVLRDSGYDTAYIGKWHLDGHGRSSYIPPERRHGFAYWKVLECTHDYNASHYYQNNDTEQRTWQGYDALAQTEDAKRYLRERQSGKPFALFMSWGPPHNPYATAPEEYRRLYDTRELKLRANVPESAQAAARTDLAGYYAHCSALDACLGQLLKTLTDLGVADDTIIVFTSDHGDMLGSHGEQRKQRPWDESIRVPFLLRCPPRLHAPARSIDAPIDTPDIMPTLLGLCGVAIPPGIEGRDLQDVVTGAPPPEDDAALFACYAPFGEWTRAHGGREYRGVRTSRFTYVRDLKGPWLLFDNQDDPFQMNNLCGRADAAETQSRLDATLQRRLRETRDAFLPGETYIAARGYVTDANGTVPYKP